MAMNETPNKRQYTSYKRHTDESHERVNATAVNNIQKDINSTQEDTIQLKDRLFEERVYTIFNNNLYANAMFIDYFKNGEYMDSLNSINISLDTTRDRILLKNTYNEGDYKSQKITSTYGEETEMNDFFLITNEEVPTGARIEYYLEMYTGQRWPIKPNVIKTPLHLTENIARGFSVIAKMYPNDMNESPRINGYAVLYWDAGVEKSYGLTNPDLKRFIETEINADDGITILTRDRAQEDKVVKVEEPADTVKLSFDFNDDGRLHYVRTEYEDYAGMGEATQLHKLYYADYVNSEGTTESVLKKIRQITKLISKDGLTEGQLSQSNEYIYDTLDSESKNLDKSTIALRGGPDLA